MAYELTNGPAPRGFHIDHLCRNTSCVNPKHLEAVTSRENTLRGLRGRLVTHCPQGHPYDEANTARTPRRRCRACDRDRRRALAKDPAYRAERAAWQRAYRREHPEKVEAGNAKRRVKRAA